MTTPEELKEAKERFENPTFAYRECSEETLRAHFQELGFSEAAIDRFFTKYADKIESASRLASYCYYVENQILVLEYASIKIPEEDLTPVGRLFWNEVQNEDTE